MNIGVCATHYLEGFILKYDEFGKQSTYSKKGEVVAGWKKFSYEALEIVG